MASTALRRAQRRRLSQLLTIATAVALVAGLAVVWVRVVETLKEPAPAGQSQALGQPGALVWDGRVFTSGAQLKAYLGRKAYRRWAVRHPTAFGAPAVATHKPTKRATKTAAKTKTKTTTTSAATATSTSTAAAPPVETTASSQSLVARVLTLLLVLGGLALGASALVPYRLAPAPLRRLYAQPDRRPVALAAATAMVLGFGVAFYLG